MRPLPAMKCCHRSVSRSGSTAATTGVIAGTSGCSPPLPPHRRRQAAERRVAAEQFVAPDPDSTALMPVSATAADT